MTPFWSRIASRVIGALILACIFGAVKTARAHTGEGPPLNPACHLTGYTAPDARNCKASQALAACEAHRAELAPPSYPNSACLHSTPNASGVGAYTGCSWPDGQAPACWAAEGGRHDYGPQPPKDCTVEPALTGSSFSGSIPGGGSVCIDTCNFVFTATNAGVGSICFGEGAGAQCSHFGSYAPDGTNCATSGAAPVPTAAEGQACDVLTGTCTGPDGSQFCATTSSGKVVCVPFATTNNGACDTETDGALCVAAADPPSGTPPASADLPSPASPPAPVNDAPDNTTPVTVSSGCTTNCTTNNNYTVNEHNYPDNPPPPDAVPPPEGTCTDVDGCDTDADNLPDVPPGTCTNPGGCPPPDGVPAGACARNGGCDTDNDGDEDAEEGACTDPDGCASPNGEEPVTPGTCTDPDGCPPNDPNGTSAGGCTNPAGCANGTPNPDSLGSCTDPNGCNGGASPGGTCVNPMGCGDSNGGSAPPGSCTRPTGCDTNGTCDPGEECGEDGNASGGTSCGAAPACSGDPIDCMIVYQSWETRCAVDSIANAEGDETLGDDQDPALLFSTEEETPVLDAEGFGWSRDCPVSSVTIATSSLGSVSGDLTEMCTAAGIGAALILLLAYLQAARIIGGA